MLHYILSFIVFIILLYFAIIKIKYPFWNRQPVYHTYDIIRSLYKTPFIVNENTPQKTKYYTPKLVVSDDYLTCSRKLKEDFINIVQCYYLNTDRILYTLRETDMDSILNGTSEISIISVYYEEKIENTIDSSGNVIKKSFYPSAVACSRYLNFWYVKNNQTNYTEMPIYLIDFICADRSKNKTELYRKIFQTHEYNQRIKNKNVLCSLIKKEIELFRGVKPFVKYDTYTYKLRNTKVHRLEKHYECVHITSENINLFVDFFYNNKDFCSKTTIYKNMIFPSIGNIQEMIKNNIIFIYCIKKGHNVYGYYFFKDSKMHYEDLESDTIQLTASVMNCTSSDIFFRGFLHCLKDILKKQKYNLMLFENIGHNTIIHHQWCQLYVPIFTNDTAYYLFNMIYPGSPFNPKSIFILQ